MGTVYIDRRGTRLGLTGGAMVIREPGASLHTIPLAFIDRLVVVGNVDLTSALLAALASNGASLTVVAGRAKHRSAFMHGFGHGDVARRLGQYRLGCDPRMSASWARRLVRLRVAAQRRLLGAALRARPDLRRPLTAALHDLGRAAESLSREDADLAALRGREGAAGAAFFRGYRTLFPQALGFVERNRRPPKDPVNAALSFGYTLVHGDAVRALAVAGLDPMFGFLHEPAYGRESLACDLTELGRARVERLVWRLFAEQKLKAAGFAREQRGVMMGKAARGVFFREYEEGAFVHRRWFARVARALARECVALAASEPDEEAVVVDGAE